jgi:glucose-1-phosphatase
LREFEKIGISMPYNNSEKKQQESQGIRAIIFDLGNVLIPLDFERALKKIMILSGKSREEIFEIFSQHPINAQYESGLVSTEEFLDCTRQMYLNDFGIQVQDEQIKEIFLDIFSEPTINPEFFRTLKEKYLLYLLSNTNVLHFEHLKEKHAFLEWFDEVFLSYNLACLKPSREIYDKVIDAIGLPADCLLFVDDMKENIEAARDAGIQGIVFRTEEQLLETMKEMGVL